MNAVTLNAPNQVSPAALSPAARAQGVALPQGPTAGGGFIDLISLLLATVSTDSEPSATTPASSSDAASSNDVGFLNGDVRANLLAPPQGVPYEAVPYKGQFTSTGPSLTNAPSPTFTNATPDQIASALIRFMARGAGPSAGTPPTAAAAKKASSDQRIANTSKITALPLFPVDQAAVALVAPQPAVAVDPQAAGKTIPLFTAVAPKAEMVNGPVSDGPAVNDAVTNELARLASPVPSLSNPSLSNPSLPAPLLPVPSAPDPSLPDPSFSGSTSPNLKLNGPIAPVAFKMQLTPVNSQEIPDPQAKPDPDSLALPQSSAASEIPFETGPATETPTPASSAADSVSSPAFATVSVAVSPTVLKGPALNEGKNPDEPDQGTPSIAAKTISDVTDQTKQDSGQKSNTATKSDAEPSTAQDQPEKNPVAAAPSAPAGNQIQGSVFPVLHAPAPPQSALSHSGTAAPKSIDQPAAPPAADAKDGLATPAPSSGQTQQIDVRISQPQAPPVDLQVAQKAGQIQVVVRTPDAGLETALRQDLGTLVHSLERSGFQAETFIPNASDSSRMNSHGDSQHKQPDSSDKGSFNHGGGQNQGRNGGRGSGGNSRGNASRDPQQFEAWTNPQDQQQEHQP